jgi:hypothetical protein
LISPAQAHVSSAPISAATSRPGPGRRAPLLRSAA